MNHTDQKVILQQVKDPEKEKFFEDIKIEFLIHELKDPIAVIETGMRSLLERQEKFGSLTDRQERIIKRALRNSQKARDMLHGLLEIGRSETGCFICCRFKPAKTAYEVLLSSLETTAERLYEQCRPDRGQKEVLLFLESKGIVFEADFSAHEMEILQDEIKFRQIVGNLFKNALHHRKDRMAIRAFCADERLCVEVSDDGPGIGGEDRERIFRRYVQVDACSLTPRKGHGLGLAGARIMARCLGGDIELESQKGKGATFRLTLPLDLNAVAG
jgi:signal transduction histidine kinase